MNELKTEFEKIDLESDFQNISLFSNGQLSFNFNNTEGVEYFEELGLKKIIAKPIHSAKRDFFSGLYNRDYHEWIVKEKKASQFFVKLECEKNQPKSPRSW